MSRKNILGLLEGEDRRTIGRANQVAAMVVRNSRLFPMLIAGLWSADPSVRMGAADAAEKVTRTNSALLGPWKQELLGLMAETTQQELRWHLAAMVPRPQLSARDRQLAASLLTGYLQDCSSIVKTFALQGLAGLAQNDPGFRPHVVKILRHAAPTGTLAMKARSRQLLQRLEPVFSPQSASIRAKR
jgi:hypothetical protein